jgi:DNA-binding NarL/FixJ family response regulator
MSKNQKCYNVAIVDDSELFPVALTAFLKEYSFMQVSGIFNNGKKMLDNMEVVQPDIIFMDLEMPEMDGVTATRLIMKKYPATRVIATSLYDHGVKVKQMLQAGAWSFITKDLTKIVFGELIMRLKQNKRYITATAAMNYTLYVNHKKNILEDNEGIYEPDNAPGMLPDVHFTPREIEVIGYLAKGLSAKEIASKICRSNRTIDAHKKNLMTKLRANNSMELVALAYKYKLL